MSDKPWLEEYSGQSTEELIALERKYRTDSLVVTFEMAVGQKEARVGPEKLAEEERAIQAVEALEREVNNGGYRQFFVNTPSKFVSIIVKALQRIGCLKTARVTQRAIDELGVSEPISDQAVDDALDREGDDLYEKLGACDDLYFDGEEDIAGCLFDFIKDNKAKISLP